MKLLYKGLLWLSILIPTSACSFTEKVTTEEYDVSKIESEFKDKEATILLTTGQQIKARNFEFSTDSIGWRASTGNSIAKFKSQDVRSITYTDRMLGGFLGMAIGFTAGLLISKSNGQAHSKTKCTGDCDQEIPILDDAVQSTADDIAEGMEASLLGALGGTLGYFVGRDAVVHGVEYLNHLDPFGEKTIEVPLSSVLREDTESIKIDYLGKKVWLSKSLITIDRKKDNIKIKMKAGLYMQNFEK
ncbi:hypothetical protein JNL27_14990 [bacterium]|nr:hypothetical protein [bacterium]